MKVKTKAISLQAQKSIYGYIFVLPFIVGFIAFFLSPFIFMIVMSFSKINYGSAGGMILVNIGFDNFKEIFLHDFEYIKSVFISTGELLAFLPSVVFFSLFISIILNQNFKGRFLARAIFFLPVLIASGINAVTGSAEGLMSNATALVQGASSGADGGEATVNITKSIVMLFGSESGIGAGFIKAVAGIVSNIFQITQASGVQILIFLAALQTIPTSLYEASHMDGATGWENFWKITLPMISPMILVNTVYTAVDRMAGADNGVIALIYDAAFMKSKFADSAAMSMIYFLIIFAAIGIIMFFLSKAVYYEDR